MKAAVCSGFGDPGVVTVQELDRPGPGPGEVLVRVRAAAMNPVDSKIRSGQFRLVFRLIHGVAPPFVLGFDFAGEVVETGEGVAGFEPGQRVFGSVRRPGTHAEYAVVPADLTVPLPDGVTMEDAGAAPVGALTALLILEEMLAVGPGQEVLLNGASGGVGSYAVQVAHRAGARVTAVASARNHDLLRELGAAECIDYREEDFAARTSAFDAIVDIVPNRSFPECRGALRPGGTYLTTIPGPGPFFWKAVTRLVPVFGGRRADFVILKPNRASLSRLAELLGSGAVRSVVGETFHMKRVREAHERMDSGHAAGKIVLSME
ncbi:MAG: NAD(P)-dependent alcohol dehydrogenase [Gemmatimonadota bacterium]